MKRTLRFLTSRKLGETRPAPVEVVPSTSIVTGKLRPHSSTQGQSFKTAYPGSFSGNEKREKRHACLNCSQGASRSERGVRMDLDYSQKGDRALCLFFAVLKRGKIRLSRFRPRFRPVFGRFRPSQMKLDFSIDSNDNRWIKNFMFFAAWWSSAIFFSANGLYAVANPGKWLRAKWTATRGFSGADPSSRMDRFKIRFLGIVMLSAGIVATTIISFVSFIAMRQWYGRHH